jgi:hypothetical protein
MTETSSTGTADLIRDLIRKAPKRWPGASLTVLPVVCAPTMRQMIADGEIKIVDKSSATRPGKTVSYIAFVSRPR